jgi:hypothetical protein
LALTARIIYSFDCGKWLLLGARISMNRKQWSILMNGVAAPRSLPVIAAMLLPLCSPAKAVQPPSDHCRLVSKIEYDSAKKQFLLRNRFGVYVRTGRLWRRHYWYCQL